MNTTLALLMICRRSGYTASACLETTLTAGVYEQHTALVLLDEAVTLLVTDQQTNEVQPKNVAQQLAALDLYGIDIVYADAGALACYGVGADSVPIAVKQLQPGELACLVADARHTVVF